MRNTDEQLRELDGDSNQLKSETMDVLTRALDCAPEEITGIELKNLRRADRAMLEAGLPVPDRDTLLTLLEDLGS